MHTVKLDVFQLYVADLNNGQHMREIAVSGLVNPVAMAVDWIGNNAYIVERTGKRIEVVSLDGANQRTVIVDYLGDPTDIAVDPNLG